MHPSSSALYLSVLPSHYSCSMTKLSFKFYLVLYDFFLLGNNLDCMVSDSSRDWLCMHTVLPLAWGKTFFLLNFPRSGFCPPSRVSVGSKPSHSFVCLAWCHDDSECLAVFQRKTPPPTPTSNYYKTWHCIVHPSLVGICFPQFSFLQRTSSSLMEEMPLSESNPRGAERGRKPWLLCIVALLLMLFCTLGTLIFTSLKVRWP